MRLWRQEYVLPAALIVAGAYFLLRNLKLISWLTPEIVWPVLLILVGVWLIVRRART